MQIETKFGIGERVNVQMAESSTTLCESCGQEIISVKQKNEVGTIRYIRFNGCNIHYGVIFGEKTYIILERNITKIEEEEDE